MENLFRLGSRNPIEIKKSLVKMTTNVKKHWKVKLTRWYGFSSKNINYIELYVFADALFYAYGTVVYFRFIQKQNVKCMPIALKSRLVPLNQKPTIPILELQAAVIVLDSKIQS